ncbi:hypothetical protein JHK85_004599 [Glycine max]|nr:hypothetical protein JHK85_004599 [Glycine max]
MRLWYAPHMELPSGVVLKGNEPVEEEVDIVGGDDPPLPSYPPAKIENGGTNKISEHNSSNSNSEFGSSSSDFSNNNTTKCVCVPLKPCLQVFARIFLFLCCVSHVSTTCRRS